MDGSVAWTEATRARYRRAPDDRQDDLTDAAGALIAPPVPAQGRMGDGPSTGSGPCCHRGARGGAGRPVVRRSFLRLAQ